jgi:osmotically-inducible protein OsmY
MSTSEEIKRRIGELFSTDSRIDPERITIEVMDTVVRLTGTVVSMAAMVAAENDVYTIPEVKRVENLLQIVYPGEKDAVEDHIIAEKLQEFLTEDVKLNISFVETGVDEGVVTLRGVIDSLDVKDHLKSLIARINGVNLIVNKLDIVTTLDKNDVEIAKRVRNTLETITELDSEMVTAGVKNGVVTLIGKVPNIDVFYNAPFLAGKVEGVKEVKNELLVI